MMYKAKVAVCSKIHAKHSTLSQQHEEFFNINPLNTKRRLFYLKTQFVPRSKHF